MVQDFTRRNFLGASTATALGLTLGVGTAAAEDGDTKGAPSVKGDITRFATTALGAEVTGPFVMANGNLVFSLQHPDRDNPAPYDKGGIGIVEGFDLLNEDFDELATPQTDTAQERVRTAAGSYRIVAQEEDPIGGGEFLGIPVTPAGGSVADFAGSRYGDFGFSPDMNQFVPTDDAGNAGYLFTNWEHSPGNISRIPLELVGDSWEADLANAENLVNDTKFRTVGGTRINCYGNMTPWGTPMSAEENYAHPRVSGSATVGDIVEAGTGVGRRGANEFWNRPNPAEIQGAVDDQFGDDSWYVQGYWALSGVELLAYYLGVDPVDQEGNANTTEPLQGPDFPNPYRYGYLVDIRNPTQENWRPLKYYVFGRSAPEGADIQSDERTVFISSDGAYKGFYKFVADAPIPSYDDPMAVAGTLYAAKVQNNTEAKSPARAPLKLDWLELGSASNAEVESWIAQYDGVDQVDYLSHAETDWEDDLETALAEADRTVAEDGNQDYVTDDEIVEWAEQYAARGPEGVDASLRKVPFLETRAAAKEIGATVEFRKSEGIDSVAGAGPGDFVYLGLSEINDGMADDEGDLQLDRVDGGAVYRGRLGPDYDVDLLEPVVVGPDGSDEAAVADDALINVDNLAVMDDERVILCEDADTLGRSYPNDCLWVYRPPEGRGTPTGNPGHDRGRSH